MSGFNPRELIHEIKIRPGIYNKDALEPPRRDHKHKLWLEVAERFTPSEEWESYTDVEKEARMDEIQMKWKHMRANFHREIKLHEAGEANKKRKYIYFDEMEFMRPYVGYKMTRVNNRGKNSIDSLDDTEDFEGHDTDMEIDALLKSSDNIDEDDCKVEEEEDESKSPIVMEGRTRSKRLIKPTPKAIQNQAATSSSNTSLQTRAQKEKEAIIKKLDAPKKTVSGTGGVSATSNNSFKIRDGDISFCLSLVPTLRKLGDGRKLRAKIEILKVLHRYVAHIERRHLVNRSSNHNSSNHGDMIEEDIIEEYDETAIKHDPDDPLHGGGGNTKTWWT